MNDVARGGFIDAVVLDLDGVVTDTAALHERAWKATFDPLLEKRGEAPFSHRDYLDHVDGKPRLDGIRSLLEARGITLDEDGETVEELGTQKNERFHELLEEHGVDVFEDAVEAIEAWRRSGLSTAMVSSSRNATRVVKAAGLEHLFDAMVDGEVGRRAGLAGKPAPDYFLEAARRLGVDPGRAAVLEDAISGVEAGRRGEFAMVVGVARDEGEADALRAHGANRVVSSLTELELSSEGVGVRSVEEVPNLLVRFDEVRARLATARPALFFDYDGTLTPIVERPEDAVLAEPMRAALAKLASEHTVAIISGRDLADVRERVGLDGVYYAGSHGFEIEGPGMTHRHEGAADAEPHLAEAAAWLEREIGAIEGVQLEPKAVALAVHYRRADERDAERVISAVEEAAERFEGLRSSRGKKVVELRPDVDWDKGRALRWVLEQLFDDPEDVVPLYVGDDFTDEDAFRAIAADGVAVLVGDHGAPTRAHYHLGDVEQTRTLLRMLGSIPSPKRGTAESHPWSLIYEDYDPKQQPLREALCTLGNGYLATRGAAEEQHAGGPHYPGTYLAGGYDRQETYLHERWVENEDLVNWPNWLHLTFRPHDGDWLSLDGVEVLSFRQELDMRCGVLERRVRIRDAKNRETELCSRRIVSMRDQHLAAEHWELTPRNWSGTLHVRSLIDGSVINSGVARYRDLEGKHHEVVDCGATGEDVIHLTVETVQSKIRMSQAARTRAWIHGEPATLERERIDSEGRVGQELTLEAQLGRSIEIEKVVAVYTSRDRAITEPLAEAVASVQRASRFEDLCDVHRLAWQQLWSRWDMELSSSVHPAQRIVRLHMFHLLQSVSPHTVDLDVGVTSRGLHGEAYRGHVFWDEIFIFPLLDLRMPEITRSLLMYRYRRLPEARRAARDAGYEGAMYPWQSGSNGREESQVIHLNPESGRWLPDDTHLQRHVNAAVTYNVWKYFQATNDMELLSFYGAEMILEIARFWASIATYDSDRARYHIRGVVGPDEFHTRYPGAEAPGLDDNAYTNLMAAWSLRCAGWVLDRIADDRVSELLAELGMTHDDVQRFDDVSRRMYVPFLDGEGRLLAQFEGYGDLEELDWDGYRRKYDNIQRLDRILEAEGDSVERYKASKQADVLMLFYLFSAEELEELFEHVDCPFDPEMIPENIEYYSGRTSMGSSLSRIVYSWVIARSDRQWSWSLFEQALRSDVDDIQGGTTPEGIHLGAMAGSVDLLQRCYGGVETRGEVLWLNPRLPAELPSLRMHIRYRGHWLDLDIRCDEVRVAFRRGWSPRVQVGVNDEVYTFEPGQSRTFSLRPSAAEARAHEETPRGER